MDNRDYGFDQRNYSDDYLNNTSQELRTSQNLDAIEKLFEEWDEDDKNDSKSFSLDNDPFDSKSSSYLNHEKNEHTPYSNSSFYEELLQDKKKHTPNHTDYNSSNIDNYENNVTNDPMDQTKEIDSVSLEQLKAIRQELYKIYNDEEENTELENNGVSQSKGKTLTKATKQGIAFSNGSLTKTFLDCVVLCFVTASMGFAFLMNIINHI